MTNSTLSPEIGKFCKKCNQTKALSAFGKDKSKKDGLSTICLECRRKYDKEREQTPERQEWRETYFSEHPELKNQWQREWQSKHRERTQQWMRNRYAQNPQRYLATRKTWNKKHADRRSITEMKRRALKKASTADFTTDQWRIALDYFGNRCAVCGAEAGMWWTLVTDHWMPLAKGGGHTAVNIIPLCHSKDGGFGGCNNAKHDKMPELWLLERFGRKKAKAILKRINDYFEWIKAQK